MNNRFNLSGLVFSKLTVLKKMPSRKGHAKWLCKCECGNEVVVDAGNLRSGHSKSCGNCQKYEHIDDKTIRCLLPIGKSFLFDASDFDFVSSHKWSIENSGYVHSMDKEKHIRLHNCLLGSPGYVVDYINGDRTDNRRCNLRVCTSKENVRNSKLSANNSSGYKGVSYDKRRKKYSSSISVDYRNHFLGYFDNPEDAARKYDEAAIRYFGEYARLNFGGA